MMIGTKARRKINTSSLNFTFTESPPLIRFFYFRKTALRRKINLSAVSHCQDINAVIFILIFFHGFVNRLYRILLINYNIFLKKTGRVKMGQPKRAHLQLPQQTERSIGDHYSMGCPRQGIPQCEMFFVNL